MQSIEPIHLSQSAGILLVAFLAILFCAEECWMYWKGKRNRNKMKPLK